jgi:hypothetical protein
MDVANLLRSIIDTPGIGGIIVVSVFFLACAIYAFLTRWILAGGEESS